ncbi:CRISPR-associated helicase Cas3' [Methylomusa anaerophila]|uniref:CRISPR-associated endonuclease/helicase Cas3 n=1 Tax=Methylomusa anaerophila TaxID=1930071 RepID=A0A348AR34_9FIRM|nr:CRISPR-associated helicase Cas3' [Methylomusa anaerophila]BBB93532.1 CRISPR-associated endonuclease/helicase Cas3 [Methylomusa anaerophila]
MSRVTEIAALLGSLLGEKRSHPGKKLIEHVLGVARLMEALSAEQGLNCDPEQIKAVALTHDIGKAHPEFQDYLEGKGEGVNHAKPSAWFTYTLLQDFWLAEVVCRHHTHLYSSKDLSKDWLPDSFSLPKQQKRMRQLVAGWPWLLSEEEYFDLEDTIMALGRDMAKSSDLDLWLRVRTLYSLLIAADRMEAIGVEQLLREPMPDFNQPIFPGRSAEVDAWRQNLQQTCLNQAREIAKPGVYTLTLPTGAGKTVTGLSVAYEWAKRFNCKSIIYALPFISIVEQTTNVAKAVFGDSAVQEDHSLAYGQEEKETEKRSPGVVAWRKVSALFRYWREPVVLTTMVQFWDAIFNSRANRTMNFHRLSNAVVILDEPQTIPPAYWRGLGDTLTYLSNKWGTFFLLMTATQPRIPAELELAPPQTFFPQVRHHYEYLPDKYPLEVLPELLAKNLPPQLSMRKNSGMVVVNTKKAALDVYRLFEAMNLEGPVLFLSGWVTPWRRQLTLKQLKKLEEDKALRYLVATQVVEAGVDVDFSWVFRDIGPLDSIIQVAGRCNRHLIGIVPGKVLIAELIGKNGRSLWNCVYSDVLVGRAKDVLQKQSVFDEKDVPAIVAEYYQRVETGLTPCDIAGNLAQGMWHDMPDLIDKSQRDTVTVFVEETDEVWPLLKKLQDQHWDLTRRDEKKRLLQQAQQYALEIPARQLRACELKCSAFYSTDGEPVFRQVFEGKAWFISKAAIRADGLYHPAIGFIPPEEDEGPQMW